MNQTLLFAIFFGLCTLISARADNLAPDTKIFLDSLDNEPDSKGNVTVTEWYIAPQTLGKLPPCDPEKGDLPLPVKAAVQIAHGELNKNVKKPQKWTLASVEIDEIDPGRSGATIPDTWTDEHSGKWYFKITFTRPVDNDDIASKHYSGPYSVYVLMDGTLAEVRTRPQTQDEIQSQQQLFDGVKKAVKDSQ